MMNLLMAGLMAIMGPAAQNDDFSGPIPPAHVTMVTVRLGHLNPNKSVPLIKDGKTINVNLEVCEIGWNDQDEFYAISAGGSVAVIRKVVADKAWEITEHNWDATITGLAQLKQVCLVSAAE